VLAPLRARLRSVDDDEDRAFLVELYGESRAGELALVDWDEGTKAAFVEQQFSAQDEHYRRNYDGATLDIVMVGGERAGRLYVHRGERDIRIVDILLAPAFRGRGIGSGLLRRLVDEARDGTRVLSVHVEMHNPARALYERLGFRRAGEHGVYVLMELEPSGTQPDAQVNTAS
jgi:ribosomal protein S18 acetylase RimI-like enzyme